MVEQVHCYCAQQWLKVKKTGGRKSRIIHRQDNAVVRFDLSLQ